MQRSLLVSLFSLLLLVGCGTISPEPATTEDTTPSTSSSQETSLVDEDDYEDPLAGDPWDDLEEEGMEEDTAFDPDRPEVVEFLSDYDDEGNAGLLLSDGSTVYVDACSGDISAFSTDRTETYMNEYFSLEVPYASDWGTEDFRFAPVDEYLDTQSSDFLYPLIQFGAPGADECTLGRLFTVTVQPKMTKQALLDQLSQEGEEFGIELAYIPREGMLNGYPTLRYAYTFHGAFPTTAIFGEEHTYFFSGLAEENEHERVLNTFEEL